MANKYLSAGNPEIVRLGEEVCLLSERISYLEYELARLRCFNDVISPILVLLLFFQVWRKVGKQTECLFRPARGETEDDMGQ